MKWPEWISVKDRLPEYTIQISGIEFIPVLIADSDGGVWAGDYTNDKFYVFGVCHPNVTHWMPFPKHPEKK